MCDGWLSYVLQCDLQSQIYFVSVCDVSYVCTLCICVCLVVLCGCSLLCFCVVHLSHVPHFEQPTYVLLNDCVKYVVYNVYVCGCPRRLLLCLYMCLCGCPMSMNFR